MRRSLLITLLLAGMPTLAAAQWIERGDYVRVSAEQYPDLRGRVKLLTARTIVVDTVRLPLSSVNGILVRRRSSYTGYGAAIGMLVGGGLGAALTDPPGESSCPGSLGPCDLDRPIAIVAGAFGGLLIGAAIGSSLNTERWEKVPLDLLRVSFTPQRDGRFALGLSLRL